MKKLLLFILMISISACNNVVTEAPVMDALKNKGEPDGPHTSSEWKIWAYSTAAPSYIASGCSVVDVDGTLLREGTNGWTAMAANPRGMANPENGWNNPHEAMPMVGDAQAMKWAMAYMGGKTPQMDHDGWAWMLHGDMGEDNTKHLVFNKEDAAEGQWIESGPHLMLFPKDPASLEGNTTDFMSGAPCIMFKGTGYDHLMIPVENYFDYQPKQ